MSKKQWKVVKDLPCTFSTKGNWSQDESDSTNRDVSEIRSVLPTKTSATRQISDLENIPQNGPFLLNFSNIPYEADENAIKNFFQGYDVINVTKNEIKRGTGIIEFKDLNNLSGALSMAEKIFISRPIRLSICMKDDLFRMKSGGQQRTRFGNQQRNPQPTISEDSDNWRTKKPQPVSQPSPDNYAPRNDRPNWRDNKPSTIRNEDNNKALSENSENWRKGTNRDPKSGNFNRRNQTMQDSGSNKPMSYAERSEPKDLIKETKKVSIFGDAKPVDTQSKDLEIEEKIAQQKKQVDETSKTDSFTPSFARNPKKPSTTSATTQNSTTTTAAAAAAATATTIDKAEKSESRTKVVPNPTKPQSNVSILQRNEQPVKSSETAKPEPPAAAEPVKVEPQPAAPPAVNVWNERLKAKGISPPTPVNRNNSASKPGLDKSSLSQQSPSTEKLDPNPTEHQVVATNNSVPQSSQLNAAGVAAAAAATAVTTESKVAQKTPVVISVNGPFLDPKSRTPHHSMSDNSSNKTPTAVPINKSSPSDNIDSRSVSKPFSSAISSSSSSELQQSKPTNTPINACSKQSSWAKGPPKGLIEKTEFNQ